MFTYYLNELARMLFASQIPEGMPDPTVAEQCDYCNTWFLTDKTEIPMCPNCNDAAYREDRYLMSQIKLERNNNC